MTYNNLGCYFNNRGKLITSLEYMGKPYLERALRAERGLDSAVHEVATTYLNICAVLSKLGRHTEALKYSEEAIMLLEKADELEDTPEIAMALVTAYHNYAIELESLKRTGEALCLFEKAWEVARERLGDSHAQSIRLRERLERLRGHTEEASEMRSAVSESIPDDSVVSAQRKRETVVLYQQFKVFNRVRHKVIILDKETLQGVKVLAFPPSKTPLLKLLVPYSTLYSIFPIRQIIPSVQQSLTPDEIHQCMEYLLELLYAHQGRLYVQGMQNTSAKTPDIKPDTRSRSRPVSAQSRTTTVITEKQGARFSVTLASDASRRSLRR